MGADGFQGTILFLNIIYTNQKSITHFWEGVKMSLATRVDRLENTIGRKRERVPDFEIRFIKPIRGADGFMRPGRCTGGLRILTGGFQQWLDADMNPIDKPA